MMTYYLLIRRISPYSGADILLGAFDSEKIAREARNSYFRNYVSKKQEITTNSWLSLIFPWLRPQLETNPMGDPWHNQAYRSDGLKKKDLVIQSFEMKDDLKSNVIYVVSFYYDSMGQIVRKFDSIHPRQSEAERRMHYIETIAENEDTTNYMPPTDFNTTIVRINKIQSDAREDQPVL